MKLKTSKLLFILLLSLTLLTRLPLFNPSAQYFFGDEVFYKRLINTLKEAEKTNKPTLYLQGVFGIYAKPGYGILYSLPIWLEKQNPNVASGAMLNVFFNSSIVVLIYLILLNFVGKRVAALGTLTVLFSMSSVIYLRHMLPYDVGLATLLLALYIYIRTKSNFLFGLLTALSLLVYPSYFYYLIPIPFIIFVFSKFQIKPPFMFGIGWAVVIFLAQIFSLLIGATPSYIVEAQRLSGVITQGDFMPAIYFFKEYILSYDGYWGLLLAFSAPLLIFHGSKRKFMPLMFYLLVVFLALEASSNVVSKTVLYGRTVRPFYLLLLVAGAISLDEIFREVSKKFRVPHSLFFAIFVLAAAISWWPRFNSFIKLTYPLAARQEAEKYLQGRHGKYLLEDVYTKKKSVDDNATDPPILESGKFYLANPTLLYPYYGNLDVPCDKEVLFEREHALSFKPYRLEGFTKEMRRYLAQDPPSYQLLYCK